MNVQYYSIYDKKAQVFGQLFPAPTVGSAERLFTDTVNGSTDNLVSKYPSDFALYQHFEFDDSSGLIIDRFEPPRLIVEAMAVVSSRSEPL